MIITFAWKIENIDLSKLPENYEWEIIEKYKKQLYETFLNDLNFSFKEHKENILFLIPYLHAKKFIQAILEKQKDKASDIVIAGFNKEFDLKFAKIWKVIIILLYI